MNITVYLGASEGNDPSFQEITEQLGTWIGSHGHHLIYGGSKIGLMGILADAALRAGGHVTGVEPQMFVDAVAQHEGIDELIVTRDMTERKKILVDRADAYIALPGGSGTLEEIADSISAVKLRHFSDPVHAARSKPIILVNWQGFYEPLRRMLAVMVRSGFLDAETADSISCISAVRELDKLLP